MLHSGLDVPKERKSIEIKRLLLDPKATLRAPRHASRTVSSYGQYVEKREFDYHLPPTGTELVGDLEVWEVLLSDGKTISEHPLAFQFDDKLLHQPTFLEGQFIHGKPLCCVWDVNNGDVYYRGPQGPPLDQEKKRKRAEEKAKAIEEAARLSEERRIKVAELEAKMKAEVEMRAKLEAEAKLKLERQGQLKQEMLEKARKEIEARVQASGPLPVVEPLPVAEQVRAKTAPAAKAEPVPAAKPAPVPVPEEAPPAAPSGMAAAPGTVQQAGVTTAPVLAKAEEAASEGNAVAETPALSAEERELEEVGDSLCLHVDYLRRRRRDRQTIGCILTQTRIPVGNRADGGGRGEQEGCRTVGPAQGGSRGCRGGRCLGTC